MPQRLSITSWLLLVVSCVLGGTATAAPPPAVAELLEDNAEALLKLLTNPTGDSGEGHVEKAVVFSGKSSIRIVPMQRFHNAIPGWKYRIVEKPGPGEYRYLRFAWKADGCAGIMLQLHDEKDWHIRYTAGVDRHNWGTKFVAEKPPAGWTVVTCDLFKDFGERNIQGIALTAFDGQAAYFDHIYFGRTLEDLDRIDATGFRNGPPIELSAAELDRLWSDLSGDDAARSYQSFWRLVAAPKQAVPFLRAKLAVPQAGPDGVKIQQWVRDLDSNRFRVREAASKELEQHLTAAVPLLEAALRDSPSVEARSRIERLLALRKRDPSEHERIEKAVRALEFGATPEAKKCLEELARGPVGVRATVAAQAALKRLEAWRR